MSTATRLPRRARRGVTAVVAAAGAVALVAGCGAPLPAPAPDPVGAVPPPVLGATQTGRVLTSLGEVLATADESRDAAALDARVFGPAKAIRRAEYVWQTASNGERTPTSLPVEGQAVITPESDTWPRTQLVVTEQPDDLQAPRILVLHQSEPRAQYRLWGWARLLPGAQMPLTAATEEGSPVLAGDDDSLLVPPAEVGARYADVLSKGDESEYAASFAADGFREAVQEARAATQGAVDGAGTLTETYTPSEAPVVALGTVDGGALVVQEMSTTSTVTLTVDGGTIPIEPFYAELAGATEASTSFTRKFTDVLVMYVPPAGSDAQVQVLAAEHAVTDAEAQ